MTEETLTLAVETLVFASEKGITVEEIKQVLQLASEIKAEEEEIINHLGLIREKYSGNFAIELVEVNGGYQFLTKKKYHHIINQLQIQRSKKKLSQAALETLAIIGCL